MKQSDFCLDIGNRRSQGTFPWALTSDAGHQPKIETWSSLVYRPGRKLRAQLLPGTAFINYLDGVHGSTWKNETIVVGNGCSRLAGYGGAKPVYQMDSEPGKGKLVYALFFGLGMMEFGTIGEADEAKIPVLNVMHPDPTDDVIEELENIFVGEHIYERNGIKRKRTIGAVNVVPEGVPAYHWLVQQKLLDPNQLNIVVDGGGLTGNAGVFDNLGLIPESRFVLHRGGAVELASKIAGAIQGQLPGEAAKIELILDGLADESCRYGTRFYFKDEARFHQIAWAQELCNEVVGRLSAWLDVVDQTAFVGGSAHYAAPFVKLLQGTGKRYFVSPEPENDNIKGLALMAAMSQPQLLKTA